MPYGQGSESKRVAGKSPSTVIQEFQIGAIELGQVERLDVATLYTEIEHTVNMLNKSTSSHQDEITEHSLVKYTLNKNITESSYDFELNAEKENGETVKIFECKEGNIKLAHPIEPKWIEIFFDVNQGKDITVNHCSNIGAAMKLVEIAATRHTKLVFSPAVLEKLELIQEGITREIEDSTFKPKNRPN